MALSDKRILEELRNGNIVIDPFIDANLSTSSYDVTLGDWFFREQTPDSKHMASPLYNLYCKEHTDRVWGTQPKRADFARNVLDESLLEGISPDERVILLHPGETILAHTNEFIGGRNTITTMMKARSSLGRNFIEVCKCAGWGDVGYINRWTMEITNNSKHYAIPLVVGRRIAQIVFFHTGDIVDKRADYTKSGKYQSSADVRMLKKAWTPHTMLPKMYMDREARAVKKATVKKTPITHKSKTSHGLRKKKI